MLAQTSLVSTTKPFLAATRAARRSQQSSRAVVCSAVLEPQPARRSIMLAGLAALPLLGMAPAAEAKLIDKVIPAKSLSAFQRKDLLSDFQARAEAEIKKVVTSADGPAAMRLLFNDAATYDAVAKTGGVNGSIVTSEELSRPENKDLKELTGRLDKARKALKATGNPGQKELTWADTFVLAAKVTQQMNWRAEKVAKNPKNGEYLVNSFGNPFTVRLGRPDTTTPDAPGRFPGPGASAADVLAFSQTFAVKDPAELSGPFGKKPPFWERIMFVLWTAAQPDPAAAEAMLAAEPAFAQYKEKYDKSRATNFRQDYEIDFNQFFNQLADLAKVDTGYYLYDVTIKVPERL